MPRSPRSRPYDGRFYARFVDPFITRLHQIVARQIEPGQRVLDVGCGTGALAFRIAPDAEEVLGVELSPAMAEYAAARAPSNVAIRLGDVLDVAASRPDRSFDVATMVLALHEMPAETRAPVLREVTRVATRLVCLDFRVPMPWNLSGVRNRMTERLAGAAHYRAFVDFYHRGGTAGVCAEAGVVHERLRLYDRRTIELSAIGSTRSATPPPDPPSSRAAPE